MSDCIFCKIVSKEIPANLVYEDDHVIAFHDISPTAPVHVLVVPKEHIESLNHITHEKKELLGHIHLCIKEIAEKLDISESGYRVVNNCGKQGGQTVGHIHFHLLGGRQLEWPAG
ncbi:histidine triad nucleotide-binding protein [Anaeromicrobium sediminis]|uniref:Histidine triad nucleotide-binding protein n=1 Tax=Anaeromicrobium sediminis TaxID=1478221 RepID=A0A267MJ95_9FIRM|nr:histidine triad nucleotide-binding protein [Anaeromicrobium sediminis]PAB58935.1 histidine triad nucleotide-binding protein [Anaeromicrobium sediminis]